MVTQAALPPLATHDAGYAPPKDVDVPAVASAFLAALAAAAAAGSGDAFAALFVAHGHWRDVLAFTREYRTFSGPAKIAQAASDLLTPNKPKNFKLGTQVPGSAPPVLEAPFPDLSWVRVHFSFETSLGPASGVARLVYDSAARAWKAYTIYTVLEEIHEHPQSVGDNRPYGKHNDKEPYEERRKRELEFADGDPDVLIIGAGHNGLACAAVLRSFGLTALNVDREERVGDNWRKRYASLSLHDPVHTDHLPLMPFPRNWPTFMPAGKLANWLEAYVDAMECNVWLKSTVDPARTRFDPSKKQWAVTVLRTLPDGSTKERVMNVSHVILSTGLVGGKPKLPAPFPGQENWGGKIVHSSRHAGGAGWKGKRVLVVGACTSGHDISVDLVNNGADTTMLQRSPTFIMSIKNGLPALDGGIYTEGSVAENGIETCDRIIDSVPKALSKEFQKRITAYLSEADKELLAGLKKAGFRTYAGPDNSGWYFLAWNRAGGYYFSAGGSEMIVSGDIKVKQGEISSFGADKSITFTDGTSGEFDLVVFCTGFTGWTDTVRETLGDDAAAQLKTVWGLDDEGELMGIARSAGIPNMFFCCGNLLTSRLYSRNIALQIIAQREGLWSEPYLK